MNQKSSLDSSISGLLSRRECLVGTAVLGLTMGRCAVASGTPTSPASAPHGVTSRRFKICFNPGMIGISADLKDSIALAEQFGFEAIEPAIGAFVNDLGPRARPIRTSPRERKEEQG